MTSMYVCCYNHWPARVTHQQILKSLSFLKLKLIIFKKKCKIYIASNSPNLQYPCTVYYHILYQVQRNIHLDCDMDLYKLHRLETHPYYCYVHSTRKQTKKPSYTHTFMHLNKICIQENRWHVALLVNKQLVKHFIVIKFNVFFVIKLKDLSISFNMVQAMQYPLFNT